MDPRKQTTCTRGPWNYGGSSSSDGHFLSPFRTRRENGERNVPIQHGQLYNYQIVGSWDDYRKESTRLGLLYGYIQYYGRNLVKFVMSRAARKRGYTTADIWYLMRQKNTENRRK